MSFFFTIAAVLSFSHCSNPPGLVVEHESAVYDSIHVSEDNFKTVCCDMLVSSTQNYKIRWK